MVGETNRETDSETNPETETENVATPTPVSDEVEVVLYRGENYTRPGMYIGKALSVNNFNRDQFRFNDHLTSVKIKNARVTLYKNSDYEGPSKSYTESVPHLDPDNDASSVVVQVPLFAVYTRNDEGVIKIFEHFEGSTSYDLSVGDLNALDDFEGEIIRVLIHNDRYTLVFYEDVNYDGLCVNVFSSWDKVKSGVNLFPTQPKSMKVFL